MYFRLAKSAIDAIQGSQKIFPRENQRLNDWFNCIVNAVLDTGIHATPAFQFHEKSTHNFLTPDNHLSVSTFQKYLSLKSSFPKRDSNSTSQLKYFSSVTLLTACDVIPVKQRCILLPDILFIRLQRIFPPTPVSCREPSLSGFGKLSTYSIFSSHCLFQTQDYVTNWREFNLSEKREFYINRDNEIE